MRRGEHTVPLLAVWSAATTVVYAVASLTIPAVAAGLGVAVFVLALVVPACWFRCWRAPRRGRIFP